MGSSFAKLLGLGKKVGIDLTHAFLNFIKSPQVHDLLSTALGQIAKTVVAELSGDAFATLTSDQKRQAAFDKISTQAEASGLTFTNSLINLLVELVVNSMKAQGQ